MPSSPPPSLWSQNTWGKWNIKYWPTIYIDNNRTHKNDEQILKYWKFCANCELNGISSVNDFSLPESQNLLLGQEDCKISEIPAWICNGLNRQTGVGFNRADCVKLPVRRFLLQQDLCSGSHTHLQNGVSGGTLILINLHQFHFPFHNINHFHFLDDQTCSQFSYVF